MLLVEEDYRIFLFLKWTEEGENIRINKREKGDFQITWGNVTKTFQ